MLTLMLLLQLHLSPAHADGGGGATVGNGGTICAVENLQLDVYNALDDEEKRSLVHQFLLDCPESADSLPWDLQKYVNFGS